MFDVDEFLEQHGKEIKMGVVGTEDLKSKPATIPMSTKPWSDYTEADYTLEQWHNACLIHLHDGPPTSKSECKLPVKTPTGTVNKNGVFAAAAALGGARGGLNAPIAKKEAAAKTLLGFYKQMNHPPPPSLMMHSNLEEFLEHHGVKGQKWGIRNPENRRRVSGDYKRISDLKGRHPSELTNKQLKSVNERLNLEQQFKRLNPNKVRSGKAQAEFILSTVGIGLTIYNMLHSPAGQHLLSLGKKKVSRQLKLF